MPKIEEMNAPFLIPKIDASISLYPNPATEYFKICGLDGTVKLTISDLCCRVLFVKQVLCNEDVSVSSLRKGVYIAKIVTSTVTVEKKLIIE